MRIVIDLQSCQQAGGAACPSFPLVQQLIRSAGQHEIWLALSNQFPDTLASLRAACSSLLPAERIVVYDTPAPDGTAQAETVIALVRDLFLNNLEPDVVFAPALFEQARMVGGITAQGAAYASAVSVSSPDAPARHASQLRHAAVLFASSAAAAAALRDVLPGSAHHIVHLGAHGDDAAAQAWRALEQAQPSRSPAAPPATRSRLALVAPLQALPENLMAQLAQHYDIDVVCGDGMDADATPPAHGTLRTAAWFEAQAAGLQRIAYHFANTAAHSFMLDMFRRHPGIVFLQDLHLCQAIAAGAGEPDVRRALLATHGYGALLDLRQIGQQQALLKYPMSRMVTDRASGVIVPAATIRELAVSWHGADSCAHWRTVSGDQAGSLYADAIETFAHRSPQARYRALLSAMQRAGIPSDPRSPLLLGAAKAIAANQPAPAARQLFVDISALAESDLKTGIQRVVRSIVLALIKTPPPGFRVEPVYGNGGERRYRYARRFTCGMLGETALAQNEALADTPIEHHAGDIFLGLDLVAHVTTQNQNLLNDMRAHGIAVHFVVYDILPLLQPDAFPYGTEAYFREYLATISQLADGLICISRSVADELSDWLAVHAAPRPSPLQIGYFHMGADIDASAPSSGLPEHAEEILAAVQARPTLLMVGTLEPRKAHAQALDAFELLWKQGLAVNLVIVGKAGWLVERVVKRLGQHPELNQRLFWLAGISDEMLTKLYASASGLLAASVGEGFGLPLIESAQHQLPIVARNLPVFREIGGPHAYYFEGEAPQDLALALAQWLEMLQNDNIPGSSAMPWLSWAASAQQLLEVVVAQRWYRTLPDKGESA
jgi:glycosyltransferase involved in cell wall biosynthesis